MLRRIGVSLRRQNRNFQTNNMPNGSNQTSATKNAISKTLKKCSKDMLKIIFWPATDPTETK